jgi:small-conductance mechanosensitive channel
VEETMSEKDESKKPAERPTVKSTNDRIDELTDTIDILSDRIHHLEMADDIKVSFQTGPVLETLEKTNAHMEALVNAANRNNNLTESIIKESTMSEKNETTKTEIPSPTFNGKSFADFDLSSLKEGDTLKIENVDKKIKNILNPRRQLAIRIACGVTGAAGGIAGTLGVQKFRAYRANRGEVDNLVELPTGTDG